MRGKKISQHLFCAFTPEELDGKGQALAANSEQFDKVDEERKAVSSTYREQLADIRGVIRKLYRDIKRKGEERPVECLAKFDDPSPGTKTVVRLDTGEVVRIEPMEDAEKQGELFAEITDLEAMLLAPDPRAYDTETPEDGEPTATDSGSDDPGSSEDEHDPE